MGPTNLDVFTENIIKDAVYGLGVVAIVLLFTSALFIRIFLVFNKYCHSRDQFSSFELTVRFMVAILLICIVQVFSILIWTAALYFGGLVDNLTLAMLFAGSCYTTIGIFSAKLPDGWRSISFYIAFSGLFSFALATSAMISMIGTINKKILQVKF